MVEKSYRNNNTVLPNPLKIDSGSRRTVSKKLRAQELRCILVPFWGIGSAYSFFRHRQAADAQKGRLLIFRTPSIPREPFSPILKHPRQRDIYLI